MTNTKKIYNYKKNIAYMILAFTLLLFLLSACGGGAALKAYPGSEQASGEVAIISRAFGQGLPVRYIASVDGEKLGITEWQDIAVLPGTHEIVVEFVFSYNFKWYYPSRKYSLFTLPGHNYQISAIQEYDNTFGRQKGYTGMINFFIRDVTNKQTVVSDKFHILDNK